MGELYGATSTANAQFINDPTLRPERSWTGELTAERDGGRSVSAMQLYGRIVETVNISQQEFQRILSRLAGR